MESENRVLRGFDEFFEDDEGLALPYGADLLLSLLAILVDGPQEQLFAEPHFDGADQSDCQADGLAVLVLEHPRAGESAEDHHPVHLLHLEKLVLGERLLLVSS